MLVKLLSFPVRSYWVDESRFQIDKFFCLLLQVLYLKLPPNVSDLEFFGHFVCLLNFFDNILCGQPFPPPRSMEPLLDVIIKILITKSCWLGVPHHRGPPSLSSRRGKWFLFKRSQGLLMPHSLTLMPPLWFFFLFHCRHKIATSIFHCHVIFTIIVIGIVRKWQTEIASNLVNCGRVWQAFGTAIFEESRRKCKWN